MEAVNEAIANDFKKWKEEGGRSKEDIDEFMEEKYAMKVEEGNIFEHIKAMSSPPSLDNVREGKSCSAGLQTLAACSKRNGQHGTASGSRRKRSSGGKGSP